MKKTALSMIILVLLCVNLVAILDNKFIRVVYHSKIPVANSIKVSNQYVYIHNDWYLYLYSIRNLWNPVIETGYMSTFPITDVENTEDSYIYICSHEPTNEITEIDSLNTFGRIYFAQRLTCNKARREGNLLYTTHRENGMEIYDISKGVSPQMVSSFTENWGLIDIEARYPILHVLNNFGYVQINVKDLTQPRTVSNNYEIVDGTVLSVDRNIVWVGAGETLYAVEITYPDKPVIVNRYRFNSEINDIKARGNDLFVGLKTTGLKILDITSPRNISEKNSFYLINGVNSIALDEDYIFLGAGTQGWYILEYR